MALINVDPDKSSDPFYRYKMPKIVVKVEGNGNGIKTVLTNLSDICERLDRQVDYPMKYFCHDLAATGKFMHDKWILTGSFPQETLQACVFDFVKKFVLCKACANPETIFVVDEKKDVWLNCKACSRVTAVDPKEKLCNFIVKNEKTEPVSGKSNKKNKGKKEMSKDEKEEADLANRTRQASEADLIAEERLAELPNPVEVLRDFIADGASDNEISAKVFGIKMDYGLDDKSVVYLVFEAIFDGDISKQIPKHAKLMARCLKPDTEKECITSLMLLCCDKEHDATLKSKFPALLKKFYDNDVISEETILAWHSGKSSKKVSKDAQKLFKEKSQPFIDWLQEEEEESDDDEEEEPEPKPTPKPAPAAEKKEEAAAAEEEDDEEVDVDDI